MSRSVRHTPIMSLCVIKAGNVKKFKISEHRSERRTVRALIASGKYDLFPHPKEYGNEWSSPRDGKQYFREYKNKPCIYVWFTSWFGMMHWDCSKNRRHFGCHQAYKKYMRK